MENERYNWRNMPREAPSSIGQWIYACPREPKAGYDEMYMRVLAVVMHESHAWSLNQASHTVDAGSWPATQPPSKFPLYQCFNSLVLGFSILSTFCPLFCHYEHCCVGSRHTSIAVAQANNSPLYFNVYKELFTVYNPTLKPSRSPETHNFFLILIHAVL